MFYLYIMFARLLLSCFLLAISIPVYAQSTAAELKQKRQRLTEQLRETTQQLEATQVKRSAAIERLNLIQRQIEQRRALIETLNAEIEINQQRTNRNELVVVSLEDDLSRLRQEYAQTVRAAYRAQHTNSWLTFILSADSFNGAFRRYRYLRQYQAYRARQSKLILQTQEMLNRKLADLEAQRIEKEELLAEAGVQDQELRTAMSNQTNMVDRLNRDERLLVEQIRQQRREQVELDRSIEDAIAAEIEERRRRERESGSTETTEVEDATFENSRGRLSWPVSGEVVKPFGRQPHPDVPSVTIMNGGIDIQTTPGARIAAVAAGEVISSRSVPGYRQVMMVRHGEYYTVYSNLDRTVALVGDTIEQGATLGFMAQDSKPLHFEIWAGRERLNPSDWLR
ncbi:MAG: peptidoglycan DD-metalloendopeptidase family protein [Bacteroidota bacterium]